MESNFQAEKWNLVAEAMSRNSPATYSADLIQAQYERVMGKSDNYTEGDGTSTDLPRRTDGAAQEKQPGWSTPSRPGAGRLDETPNTITTPANHAEHGRQKEPKSRLQQQIEHSERMRRVWAKRRASGTDGRGGTASKKARKADSSTMTVKLGSSSAPAVTPQQSAPIPEPLAKQTQPMVSEHEPGHAANQHRQSLAQIIPTNPQNEAHGGIVKHGDLSGKESVVQNAPRAPC